MSEIAARNLARTLILPLLIFGSMQVGIAARNAYAQELPAQFYDYVSEGVLGRGVIPDWTSEIVRRLQTPELDIVVRVPQRLSSQNTFLSENASKASRLLRFTLAIETRRLALASGALRFGKPSIDIDHVSPDIKPGQLEIIVGANSEEGLLQLSNILEFVTEAGSHDASTSLKTDDLAFGCSQHLVVTSAGVLASILVISEFANARQALYCANYALLSALGFRGQISGIEPCDSVRCERNPSVNVTEADVAMYAFLYDRNTQSISNAAELAAIALQWTEDSFGKSEH